MTRFILLSVSILFLSSCERAKFGKINDPEELATEDAGSDPLGEKQTLENCSVTESDDPEVLAIVTCPDGTSVEIPRPLNGEDGVDGKEGVAGQDGRDGVDGIDGQDGLNGQKGADGQDGKNGDSCRVEEVADGALISCGATSAFVRHGKDGQAGTSCSVSPVDDSTALLECGDGSSALLDVADDSSFQVAEIYDPCGDHPGHYDEVLVRFSNGDLLAYFEVRGKRFLSLLEPGTYRTTDEQRCRFRVDEEGRVSEI